MPSDQYTTQIREDLTNVIVWKNISGATVPAYGVVQMQSFNAGGYAECIKPLEYGDVWFINGPTPVLDNNFGSSLPAHTPQPVLLEGSNLYEGQTVSPCGGQWSMQHGSRYLMLTPIDGNGIGVVVQAPASRRRRAVLLEHLDCADDIYAAPKTALAKLLFVNSSSVLQDEQLSGGGDRVVQVINLYTGIEFTAGTYVKIEYIDQAWEIYAADCPGFCESV